MPRMLSPFKLTNNLKAGGPLISDAESTATYRPPNPAAHAAK